MDAFSFVFTRILTFIAAVGAIGCCLVIPITAYQILKVAFDTDDEQELKDELRASGLRATAHS